jgi:hypothetical protein
MLHQKEQIISYCLHLHTHFDKYKIKDVFTYSYLPTRYPQEPVGKWETSTF